MTTQLPPHLNLPLANPSSAPSSGPGTPMSGVSTVAIKDGHEGSRRHNADAAAERLTRLAALETTSAPDYFVDVDRRPEPPSSNASVASTTTPGLEGLKKKKQQASSRTSASDGQGDGESTSSGREQREKARYVGGMTYDESVIDTTVRTPQEVAEDTL